jgi:hypothetical protein
MSEKQKTPVETIVEQHATLQPKQFTKWLIANSERLLREEQLLINNSMS